MMTSSRCGSSLEGEAAPREDHSELGSAEARGTSGEGWEAQPWRMGGREVVAGVTG